MTLKKYIKKWQEIKHKKLIFIGCSFIVSTISILFRINFGKTDITLFGLFVFPMSICLSYLIPKEDTFLKKISFLFLTIIITCPILFVMLSIEDHFLTNHLATNGISIKAPITNTSIYGRGKTYYFSYELDYQTYYHSVSYSRSNYSIGDTIEL